MKNMKDDGRRSNKDKAMNYVGHLSLGLYLNRLETLKISRRALWGFISLLLPLVILLGRVKEGEGEEVWEEGRRQKIGLGNI